MNSKTLTLLLAILAQGLLAPTGLVAEVLHVYPDGRGQYPTIQSAINEASPGDTVALADGTYRGDGNRDIEYHGKPITVASVSDEPSLCIIDCQGSESAPHRGFYFRGGESPTSVLRGITITAGYALDLGGGIRCQMDSLATTSNPTVQYCHIHECYAPLGAGIGIGLSGFTAPFENDDFSSPFITNCDISNNYGDGVYLCHINSAINQQHNIEHCSFHNNQGSGLLVEIASFSMVRVIDCSAHHNDDTGISIYLEEGQVVIQDGAAVNNGLHGIRVNSGNGVSADVDNVSICGNEGSGMYSMGEVIGTIHNCDIQDNGENGLHAQYSWQATDCQIIGNGGYGIIVPTGSAVTGCLVNSNRLGGICVLAIDLFQLVVDVTHSTVVHNGGSGIQADSETRHQASIVCAANIIAYNRSEGIRCGADWSVAATQSDIFGNMRGDWTDCIAGQENDAGNMCTDPGFCIGTVRPFFLREGSACAAENNGGVQIGAFPIGCGVTSVAIMPPPSACRLRPSVPNPFNPETTLRFDLPVEGRVRLEVYDVAGRLVRTLLDADIPAGSHQAVWDGKDGSGRGMPSGSYFARLSADGRVETVRMGLVR